MVLCRYTNSVIICGKEQREIKEERAKNRKEKVGESKNRKRKIKRVAMIAREKLRERQEFTRIDRDKNFEKN